MNYFSRLRNLHRINKLYGLLRQLKEKPETRSSVKHWIRIWETALAVKEIQEMLAGYKSYIVAALAAAVTVAHSLGYIDDATFNTLMSLLGAGAVGTVAAKINRMNKQQPKK